jgi:hypothetical protein
MPTPQLSGELLATENFFYTAEFFGLGSRPSLAEVAAAGDRYTQRCNSGESFTLGFGTTEKRSLNEGRIPNPNGVRVAPGTGYHRVEGNRRASRNGRVSDLPPETPNVTTIRNLFHRFKDPTEIQG